MAHPFELLVAPAAKERDQAPLEPTDHDLGRSRGGFATKLHILCDSVGHPLYFELSAGHVHDSKMFGAVLDGANHTLYWESGKAMPWPLALAGDKGYPVTALVASMRRLRVANAASEFPPGSCVMASAFARSALALASLFAKSETDSEWAATWVGDNTSWLAAVVGALREEGLQPSASEQPRPRRTLLMRRR
ncbi:MAG: transposase [Myxococcales bacterium]|nr:transposase [Myxococcales bacterium]